MDAGLESLYREVILDHYKNPRGHGVIEDADAEAEGQNPLCGDEVSIYVAFGEDGETIDEVKFSGRGCAISQAATSMLREMTKGRTAEAGAARDEEEPSPDIAVPSTPRARSARATGTRIAAAWSVPGTGRCSSCRPEDRSRCRRPSPLSPIRSA